MTDWDGNPLQGDGEIAIVFPKNEESNDGHTVLFAVAHGSVQTPICLSKENIGTFLISHAERRFVCHDAADLHWKLVQLLEKTGDKEAIQILWDLPRDNRLHDVMLLDQRVRHVHKKINPVGKNITELIKAYCPKDTDQSAVSAILNVYDEILTLADPIADRLRMSPWLVRAFGPLGHGIDVRGAIAVQAPNRTIHFDPLEANRLYKQLVKIYAANSQILHKNRETRQIFEWDGESVIRDEQGHVALRQARMRSWLEKQLKSMADINAQSWPIPLNDKGRTSWDPAHYGLLAHCRPDLLAWSHLIRAGRGMQIFLHLTPPEPKLQPHYRVVPRIHAFQPEFSYLRTVASGFVVAGEGQRLINCQFKQLEARCLALVLRKYRYDGSLSVAFESCSNAIQAIAEKMEKFISSNRADFKLRGFTPDEMKSWIRMLLESVPRGFSLEQIHGIFRGVTGDETFSLKEVQELYDVFARNICPEIAQFLDDVMLEEVGPHKFFYILQSFGEPEIS